ncbi:hypothetical protein GGI25_004975 [Coemansia spiralis]|uniref:Arrestin-like N-terminal domain-containing protein n=2 Tax=Coemansia TaxID=4863 RepID=A0A9W8KWN3_9FUNG|nr:hypothetical protein BX070DRAFT_217995 [Coemansia spiralis]KAJ1989144.1 hypothetical protein EDC05_004867 [Coemansia umbellata]KAJ2620109.1 hypothetical protein GGI26_005281 [Coemansia sp. RSA 1358]KAJ2672780.1 hypothetical protein GGI25_004975 [Coemansia spiralis]
MWTNGTPKTELSIHLYTPQITITSGSETNLLLGHVDLVLDRPTEIKSLRVTFSGMYSAYWVEGAGQSRNEYFQNKRFHHETITLSQSHLEAAPGELPLELCLRNMSGWEAVSVDNSDDSDTENTWSAPMSPPPPQAPALSGSAWTKRQYPETNGFVLPTGTHRFQFNMRLPPRMPSTITSAAGGIEYVLAAKLKTRGTLGIPTFARAGCPVHIVNLPSRFAQLQSSLPANDEAIFTKQVDQWWILARLSSCTVSPRDTVQLSVTLAWPERCEYHSDVSEFIQLSSVQMDMYEATTYRSLTTGAVLKKIKQPVASSTDGGQSELAKTKQPVASGAGGGQGEPEKPGNLLNHEPVLFSNNKNGAGSRSQIVGTATRAMFNEDYKRIFRLQIPRQRPRESKNGVHIDCRSVPICVTHELRMSLQVFDKVSRKMHLVPFHCQMIVVPEAESFYLPAYQSAGLDTRVM